MEQSETDSSMATSSADDATAVAVTEASTAEGGSIQECKMFRKAIEGNQDKLVQEIEMEGNGLWIKLKARKVLLDEQIQICQKQETKEKQIEKLLELLVRRDDCHFEQFCEALEASDQRGVVSRYFQKHRVSVESSSRSSAVKRSADDELSAGDDTAVGRHKLPRHECTYSRETRTLTTSAVRRVSLVCSPAAAAACYSPPTRHVAPPTSYICIVNTSLTYVRSLTVMTKLL